MFSAAAAAWLAHPRRWSPATLHRYEQVLRLDLLPRLGCLPLSTIDEAVLVDLVRRLSLQRAPAGVVAADRVARAVVRWADPHNEAVAAGGAMTRSPRVLVTSVTAAQTAALTDALAPWSRAAVVLASEAGLRPAEIFALRQGDVDWESRQLTVTSQVDSWGALVPVNRPSARRVLPLPPGLTRSLDALGPDLLVARPGLSHRPVSLVYFNNTHWTPALRSTGLPTALRLMDLRHSYALALIRSGVTLEGLRDRLGLADKFDVRKAYAAYLPDRQF